MANYVFIDKYEGRGKIGINCYVFEQISERVIEVLDGALVPKPGQIWWLQKPIQTSIRSGQVVITLSVIISFGVDSSEISLKIQETIASELLQMCELVPFRVNVRIVAVKK
jgi:hypothetical protein